MFDCVNYRFALCDGGSALDIHDVASQSAHFRLPRQIDTAENDTGILRSRLQSDRRPRTGMQSNSGKKRTFCNSLLHFHKKNSNFDLTKTLSRFII